MVDCFQLFSFYHVLKFLSFFLLRINCYSTLKLQQSKAFRGHGCPPDTSTADRNTDRAEIDKQAEDMFFRLVNQLAKQEGVTEQHKAENQMLWVRKMNNIRNQVAEIVNNETVYQ